MSTRGFYRLAVLLPLLGFAIAAAIRALGGADEAAPAVPGGRTESLYPSWVVAGVPALAHSQALRLLAEERELIVLRTAVKLAVSYAYLALIQWAAARWVERPDAAPGHSAGA